MRTGRAITLAGVLGAAAGAASGQVADLTVDQSQSSITARICLDPGFGERCDTDSSPIAGSVSVELDDYGTPTAIVLHDFFLELTNAMVYDFSWGPFIGSLKITLTDVAAVYANPGVPTGPVGVDGAGGFTFAAVETLLTGNGAYVGSGPIIGPLIGSGEFNLADFGVMETAFTGVVWVIGDQVVLTSTMTFMVEGEVEGVQTTLDGTATIVASGPVPPPECKADFNGDTVVNSLDFIAFLNAYTAGDPAADFNGDTVVNSLDVLAFLNAFVAGCD